MAGGSKVRVRNKRTGEEREVTEDQWAKNSGNPNFELVGGGASVAGGEPVMMSKGGRPPIPVQFDKVQEASADGYTPYEPPPPPTSGVEALSMGAAQGATSGLAPRIAAKTIDTITGESGRNISDALGVARYIPGMMVPAALAKMALDATGGPRLREESVGTEEENLRDIQQRYQQARSEHPALAGTGEVLGAGLQGYGAGNVLRAVGPMVAPATAQRVAQAGQALRGPGALKTAGRVGLGLGAAGAAAGAEGAVRSAADTPAGQEVDPEQVKRDAGVAGLFGMGGAALMQGLSYAARKGFNALRKEGTEYGVRMRQLDQAGGRTGPTGVTYPEEAERVMRERAQPAAETVRLKPSERKVEASTLVSRNLAKRAATKTVIPKVREADKQLHQELAEQSAEFAPPPTVKSLLPRTRARLQELIARRTDDYGEDLPWVDNKDLRKVLGQLPSGEDTAGRMQRVETARQKALAELAEIDGMMSGQSPMSPVPAGSPDPVMDVVHELSGAKRGRVRIADIKARLPDMSLEDIHRRLLAGADDDSLVLYRNDNPRDLLPDDEDAALLVGGGSPRHLVYPTKPRKAAPAPTSTADMSFYGMDPASAPTREDLVMRRDELAGYLEGLDAEAQALLSTPPGLTAQEVDEVVGGLDRLARWESAYGQKDDTAKELAAAIRDDRSADFGKQWANLKEAHARRLVESDNRRYILNMRDKKHIPRDPQQLPYDIADRVTGLLEGWTPSRDEELVNVFEDLKIMDQLKPVRGTAAGAALESSEPRTVYGSGGTFAQVGGARTIGQRFDPLLQLFKRQSDATRQAQQGAFLGSSSEQIESVVGDSPRRTIDFLLLQKEIKERQEREQR